jgi:hypothetical protein
MLSISKSIKYAARNPIWGGQNIPFGRHISGTLRRIRGAVMDTSYCSYLIYRYFPWKDDGNFDLRRVFLYHTIWNANFHRNATLAVNAGTLMIEAGNTPPDNRTRFAWVFIPAKQKES